MPTIAQGVKPQDSSRTTCCMEDLLVYQLTFSSTRRQMKCMALTRTMCIVGRKGCEAYQIASKAASKLAAHGKAHYDQKTRGRDLQPGDRVLIRNLTPRGGTGKIRSYWEDQVYVVKERKHAKSPVYEVRKGKSRVIHRNLLLPCDFLPLEIEKPDRLRSRHTLNTSKGDKTNRDKRRFPVNSESDSEEEYVLTCPWQEKDHTPLNQRAPPFVTRDGTPQSEEDLPLQSEEDVPLQNCAVGEDLPLNLEKNAGHSSNNDIDIDNAVSDSESEMDSPKSVRLYPKRQRQKSVVFTYDTLGQPSLVQRDCSVELKRLPASTVPFWRPWSIVGSC